MKIVFVRHAHPDYKLDCLTKLGHPQAEAAAERLKNENFSEIYSSSRGRAYETACHIAAKHSLEVKQLDFMREISWGGEEGCNAQPWHVTSDWVKDGISVMNPDWRDVGKFSGNEIVKCYDYVSEEFDRWISGFGLIREGEYYRISKKCDDTIALVSHGGSSSVVISHILNLPFSFVCYAMRPNFTAITVVNFTGEEGELTSPRLLLLNDDKHLAGVGDAVYGN